MGNAESITDIDFEVMKQLDYKTLRNAPLINRDYYHLSKSDTYKNILEEKYQELVKGVKEQIYKRMVNYINVGNKIALEKHDVIYYYIITYGNVSLINSTNYTQYSISKNVLLNHVAMIINSGGVITTMGPNSVILPGAEVSRGESRFVMRSTIDVSKTIKLMIDE